MISQKNLAESILSHNAQIWPARPWGRTWYVGTEGSVELWGKEGATAVPRNWDVVSINVEFRQGTLWENKSKEL